MLVAGWFLSAVPISAGIVSWSAEPVPSTSGYVLFPRADVADLAVARDGTMYVVTGKDAYCYKSTNGGVTWLQLSYNFGTTLSFVGIAPDDANIAAIVADDNEVYVTTDGGKSWSSLGTPKEGAEAAASAVYDITISAASFGINYVAVAGIEAGPLANVWYYDFGAASPSWKETNTKAGFGATSVNSRAAAVAFSPNFASDKVMVAITEDYYHGSYVRFEIFSLNKNEWNGDAGFSGYPVTIASGTGITGLDSASISLAPDYLGSDDALRMAFVGLTVAGDTYAVATSGIYRLTDNRVKALKTDAKIHSVAFDGTNLVAGRRDTTTVYRSADPLASSPSVKSSAGLKSPGGVDKVIVAWAGSDVVTGTAGNESAFAVSRDNGKTFNDISLIDTTLATLSDVAVSPDGSKVYLATDDAQDMSLWRYTSSWKRVLSRAGETGYIVRIAPEDPDVVYVAKRNSTTLYYTQEGGDTRWSTRTSKYAIQNLAVESANVAYVAVYGTNLVSKSTNGGFTWGSAKDTGLGSGNIHTITSLGEDKLIVGSTTGYVSYSTDGNSSWTNMSQQIESDALKVQVTASGLDNDNGDYIYAASSKADTKVLRWQIDTSTAWEDMTAPTTATYGAYGIALHDGVLYVANSDATANSEFLRTPNPTASVVFWSTFAIPGKTFITEPSALRVSTGSTKLWAIDTIQPALFGFGDTVALVAPPVEVAPTPEITVEVPPAPSVTLPAPEIIIPTPEIVLPAPQVTLPPTPAPVAPIPCWALYVIIIGAGVGTAITVRHSVKMRQYKEWQEQAKEEKSAEEKESTEPCKPCTSDIRKKKLELESALHKITYISLSACDPVSGEQSKEGQVRDNIVDGLNKVVTAHCQGEKAEKLQEQTARLAHQLLQQIIEWLHGEPVPRDISIVGHLAGDKVTYQFTRYHCKRRGNVSMWVEEKKWKDTVENKREERVGILRNLDPTDREILEKNVPDLTRFLMQFIEKV